MGKIVLLRGREGGDTGAGDLEDGEEDEGKEGEGQSGVKGVYFYAVVVTGRMGQAESLESFKVGGCGMRVWNESGTSR